MGDTAKSKRSDGFVERGHQVTRLEAFVDAAFAFALTLLVISPGVPDSVDDLMTGLLQVPGLLCSFALLAMLWFAHNTWSRRFGLDDFGSNVLSLALVFVVIVYIYPLRMLFGSLFGWVSRLAGYDYDASLWGFEVHSYADIQTMFVVYGIAWSVIGVVIALLYRRAWKLRDAIGLDLEERVATRMEVARWLCLPVTGVVSVVVAFSIPWGGSGVPEWLLGAPGFVYFGMFATHPVMQLAGKRARSKLAS